MLLAASIALTVKSCFTCKRIRLCNCHGIHMLYYKIF